MSEELKRLCQDLYLKSTLPKINFGGEFIEMAPAINEAISAFPGLKTDVYPSLRAGTLTDVKVALVMSDFTSVFIREGGDMEIFGSTEPTRAIPRRVAIPDELVEPLEHHEGKPILTGGFIRSIGKETDDFLRQVEALAQSGRLMVRPRQVVMGINKEPHTDGGRVITGIPVEPNSPADIWITKERIETPDSLALKEGEAAPGLESELGSFMIPYLEGITFERLSEILDDEEDTLASFRAGVRTMLVEVRNDPSKSDDLFNDIVRPATEKVERRFKSIAAIHGLNVAGATVGTATLGLFALTSAGIGAAIAGVLGAGGLGLITKEVSDYLKQKADLREMPFYLLWRLGRERKGGGLKEARYLSGSKPPEVRIQVAAPRYASKKRQGMKGKDSEQPKRWVLNYTFKPEDADQLKELDEFMAWPAHRDPQQGFVFPIPETGKQWLVYCESYEADDSDPNLKKRRAVLVHIEDPNRPRPEGVL